jgi:hypothetical protein
MAVTLGAILAAFVVLATGTILAINLITLRNAETTEAEILQERQRIVRPCLVMIGVAASFWAIMSPLSILWNLVGLAPFAGMFLRFH